MSTREILAELEQEWATLKAASKATPTGVRQLLPEEPETPAVDWGLFERVVIPAFTKYHDEIRQSFYNGIDLDELKDDWSSWPEERSGCFPTFYYYVLGEEGNTPRSVSTAKKLLIQLELLDRMNKEFPL